MSLTSAFLRASFKRSDDRRDKGLETPERIQRYDDLVYGPDATWNKLDVYRLKALDGPLPVIVSVHGGGWVYGDKERYQYYCMDLAGRGFAVVNFTYRLAPEFKFPASLEDTNLVFSWVLEHAADYGFDTGRIFGVGDSAGAHILALYCCACGDEGYAKRLGIRPPAGFMPKAVALNCGCYHIEAGKKMDLTTRLMKDLMPQGGTPEELELVDVLGHVTAAFPPAFVMTSDGDFLAPQAGPMVHRLEELGVMVNSRFYHGDKDHPLGHVFHCNLKLEAAGACNRDTCDFFRSIP